MPARGKCIWHLASTVFHSNSSSYRLLNTFKEEGEGRQRHESRRGGGRGGEILMMH